MISIICESINEDYPTERSRGGPEPDDSLTNMEWLPEVSIPYMQQVRCKISQEDMKKMPRKRNRNVPSTSGELELLLVLSPGVTALTTVQLFQVELFCLKTNQFFLLRRKLQI